MAASATMFSNITHPQALTAPRVTPQSSSNKSSDSGSNVSANDFLTLLVTEMKNQDPTSAQDPNQYVNQLVSVNSLEQLIQINETLSTALTPKAQAQPSGGSQAASAVAANQSAQQQSIQGPPVAIITGNLPIPETSPAAQRIATALAPHAGKASNPSARW